MDSYEANAAELLVSVYAKLDRFAARLVLQKARLRLNKSNSQPVVAEIQDVLEVDKFVSAMIEETIIDEKFLKEIFEEQNCE